MNEIWSDGRCTTPWPVSIGEMLLNQPPLVTSLATVHAGVAGFDNHRAMDKEEKKIAHRQRQEEWMLRMEPELDMYREIKRWAKADGVGWPGW